MSNEEHHRGSLIETARTELDRAHRGALAMDASEVRRGLQLALTALQAASAEGEAAGATPGIPQLDEIIGKLSRALADLDGGSLAEMETLIEDARLVLA